ncbi:MAG: zinc ribbon domain-containing protein [Anaerolineae bacterium]|nr:zinc ribbon domain-containing protein [Anaerolineae bacterium]
MLKKRKWVIYAVIITGVIVVGLLAFAINRGPWFTGFEPAEQEPEIGAICLWCGEEGPTSVWDIVGTGLIMLLMFLIPSGHIALLIWVANWFQHLPQSTAKHPALACPHCGREVYAQWKACPHCGEKL